MSERCRLFYSLCVMLSVSVTACSFENAAYSRYIGDKNDVQTCRGYCSGSERIGSEADCKEKGGSWVHAVCRDGKQKVVDDVASEQDCLSRNDRETESIFTWSEGYCMLPEASCTGDFQWVDYSMIDIGEGQYIRRVKDGESIRYLCGTYQAVLSNSALECDDAQIKLYVEDFDYQLCKKGSSCRGAYYRTGESGGKAYSTAMCSSCDPDMAVCANGDGFACTDLENNPKHCGYCGNACEEKYSCKEGVCVTDCPDDSTICGESGEKYCAALQNDPKNCGSCGNICGEDEYCQAGHCENECKLAVCKSGNEKLCIDLQTNHDHCGRCNNSCGEGASCKNGLCESLCTAPAFYCSFGDNQYCVDPSKPEQCGATTCDDVKTMASCEEGYICDVDGDGKYGCVCPTGVVKTMEVDGKTVHSCIDPSTNVHCGATAENPDGFPCAEKTSCQAYEVIDEEGSITGTGYRCTCVGSWLLSCYNEDNAGVNCIDPATDSDYCSAPSCSDKSHVCEPDRFCSEGVCVCKSQYVTCDGNCITPDNDPKHCGARGLCSDDDENSDNYVGEVCGNNEVCQNGKCVCDSNSWLCDGQCVRAKVDQACSISYEDDGSCNIVDCTAEGRVCKIGSEKKYVCMCPAGTIDCDGTCIDPESNTKYCGARGLCDSEIDTNDDYRGVDCSTVEGKPACAGGLCVSNCPEGQVDCNGACVTKEEYHLNPTCTNCGQVNYVNYCYTGERVYDNKNNIIDFDYRKCLLKDAQGNDLNQLGSVMFCGESCKTATACPDGFTCDSGLCVCLSDGLACPETASELDDESAVKKCVSKAKTHQISCGVCEEGYADCDGNLWNGCEAHLGSDVDHCGSCEHKCTSDNVQNATGITCNEGQCDFGQCKENYGSCDNNRTNGCEQFNLLGDANNCGDCDRVCSGGGCYKGECCDGGGATNKDKDKLNCCDSLKKYYYKHSGFWIFSIKCTDSSRYSCLANNPDPECWTEVE